MTRAATTRFLYDGGQVVAEAEVSAMIVDTPDTQAIAARNV